VRAVARTGSESKTQTPSSRVARTQRSGIRECPTGHKISPHANSAPRIPDSISLHPGYKLNSNIWYSRYMKKVAPTKAEIALLEPFVGLTLARIHVPTSSPEFASASAEIKAAGIVGFDTESKPTFVTGDVSEGPHVVQFALHDKAYLFQLHRADGHPFLIELLQSEQVIKVGFDLKSDSRHTYAKLGMHLGGVVDLNTVFSMDGYHKEMGVRAAVALVFKQRFAKSRHVTTSNWSQPQLNHERLNRSSYISQALSNRITPPVHPTLIVSLAAKRPSSISLASGFSSCA